MGHNDLGYQGACALAAAIRAKELSPVEVLEACLRRADEVGPRLNALVWRNDEDAAAAALRAEEMVMKMAPEDLPLFLGVPLPVKDTTPVAGWPVTYGSLAAPDGPSTESELVVEALARAGFLLTGRTNVPEFGALFTSENLRYGPTRNPWDLNRSAGGSSGGAAAVTAAGIFSIAHGNDGGGSLRVPASCCGLVGLKVSRGRVPTRYFSWEGGVVQGVLTRDVADTAAVLDVICGPDDGQWYNAPAPERPFSTEVNANPGRLRVGLLDEAPFGLPVDDACAQAVHEAGAALEQLGHDVFPTTFTVPDEFLSAFLDIANSGLADYDGIDWERAEPHIRANHQAAVGVNSLAYVRAVHLLQRLSGPIVSRWGTEFDVMLTPTLSQPPPPAGAVLAAVHASAGSGLALEVLQMSLFTAGFNVTGQPAISLPTHMSPDGWPIGVQLVGGPWAEALLLRVSAQLEQALPWTGRRPSL